MSEVWPWLALFALGAYHGLNPAMGWLFAVALGMQEGRRRAVLAALPPIAIGHALSIAIVLAVVSVAESSLSMNALRIGSAALLFGFGLYRIVRFRHPKWVGMRVGFRDLVLWSFIMASAHGAGLMLVPVLLGWPEGAAQEAGSHADHMAALQPAEGIAGAQAASLPALLRAVGVIGVHTSGHLLLSAALALLIYEKLGVAVLQRAWFNLDLLWSIVLMLSAVLILLL